MLQVAVVQTLAGVGNAVTAAEAEVAGTNVKDASATRNETARCSDFLNPQVFTSNFPLVHWREPFQGYLGVYKRNLTLFGIANRNK
jgi:hypothetical protein